MRFTARNLVLFVCTAVIEERLEVMAVRAQVHKVVIVQVYNKIVVNRCEQCKFRNSQPSKTTGGMWKIV